MCKVKIKPITKSMLKEKGFSNKSLAKETGVSTATITHMCDADYCKSYQFKSETVNQVLSKLVENVIDYIVETNPSSVEKRNKKEKKLCEPNAVFKQIRESKGLDPRSLEDAAHVRHGLVGDIENGRDTVSDSQLAKLARVLETTVDALKGVTQVQTELELVDDVSTEVCASASWFDILKEEVIIAHEEFKKATKSEDRERYACIVRNGIHDLYRMLEENNQCL